LSSYLPCPLSCLCTAEHESGIRDLDLVLTTALAMVRSIEATRRKFCLGTVRRVYSCLNCVWPERLHPCLCRFLLGYAPPTNTHSLVFSSSRAPQADCRVLISLLVLYYSVILCRQPPCACETTRRPAVTHVVVMKSSVSWDITPCSPLKVNRRFFSLLVTFVRYNGSLCMSRHRYCLFRHPLGPISAVPLSVLLLCQGQYK
jgi:hypothetical protein